MVCLSTTPLTWLLNLTLLDLYNHLVDIGFCKRLSRCGHCHAPLRARGLETDRFRDNTAATTRAPHSRTDTHAHALTH